MTEEPYGIINGQINMEISDHKDQQHPTCPKCGGLLLQTKENWRYDRDGDRETLGWNVICKDCALTGVLHND